MRYVYDNGLQDMGLASHTKVFNKLVLSSSMRLWMHFTQ